VNPSRLVLIFCLAGLLIPLAAQNPQIEAYRNARELQEAGRYYAAVEAYTGLVQTYPSYVDPYAGLAESFFMLGEYADALDYIESAIRLRRGDSGLKVLKGRILVGSGRFDQGRELFAQVLKSEPNNIEARLGMAELDVAEGKVGDAMQTYSEALELIPNDRRALLGLLLLSDELERFETSESYVGAAVRYHGDSPQVQVAVARHYMKRGRYEDALYHARLAVSLQPDYYPALIAASQAQLAVMEYAAAVESLTEALRVRPGDPTTLYTLGTGYAMVGNLEQAIRSYTAVFRTRPDDELTRFALEQLVRRETGEEYPLRRILADYHLKRGADFEERFLLSKALREYRLAVQLLPSDPDYRREFARVYRILGFPARYLRELEVIAAEGGNGREIEDELEIQRSLQESGVARSWGIDQFTIDRDEYEVGIYLVRDSSRMVHFAGEEVAASRFINLLGTAEHISVPDREYTRAGSYADAFRLSRTGGEDYFGILGFIETERTFTVNLDLYLSANGKLLRRFRVYRTGNDRITEALAKTTSNLEDSLPWRGTLIRRQFDRGLLDLGRFDGLQGGEEFHIVRAGRVRLLRESLGFDYRQEDIVGSFTVDTLDELVSEGTISKKGFFDYVNEGDILILPAQETPADEAQDAPREGLYQELLTIQ
jgi:tetratricopeptide (TPR) repeat protein